MERIAVEAGVVTEPVSALAVMTTGAVVLRMGAGSAAALIAGRLAGILLPHDIREGRDLGRGIFRRSESLSGGRETRHLVAGTRHGAPVG